MIRTMECQRAQGALITSMPADQQSGAASFFAQVEQEAIRLGQTIPWLKVLQAFMIAAQGGFSPAAIAAALASIFGVTGPVQSA